jgi:RHS repeat-associated protein
LVSGGTSGTTTNPFRFVGQQGYYADTDRGTYYIRERTYDPTQGRFITKDPVFTDGQNLYIYVENQPVIAVDPSGTLKVTTIASDLDNLTCGSSPAVEQMYSLDPGKRCSTRGRSAGGYFVQRVFYRCNIVDCVTGNIEHCKRNFWEASESPTGQPITDTSRKTCFRGTSGQVVAIAQIRFYCKRVIGDLSRKWKREPPVCTGRCVINTGEFATEDAGLADFWYDYKKYKPLQSGASRIYIATWSCCNAPCGEVKQSCYGFARDQY